MYHADAGRGLIAPRKLDLAELLERVGRVDRDIVEGRADIALILLLRDCQRIMSVVEIDAAN